MTAQSKVFLFVGCIIGVSWLSLALVDVDRSSGISEILGLGYFFGSLFAHATLAAAWTVLGPARLIWRGPLSLLWLTMLSLAVFMNFAFNGGPWELAPLLGACFLGQWILLQFPLWGLKAGFRLHLRHVSEQQAYNPQHWQFGIRQLLIITTIAGVIFGLARFVISTLPAYSFFDEEVLVFPFLAASAIVFSLPLLLAALLQRHAIPGVVVALLYIGIATFLEVPLLQTATGSTRRPNFYDLLAINLFTAALTLVVAWTVRLCGYRLTRLQQV